LVKQLARAALQAALIGNGPLAGLFGGGKGLLGSLFSGIGGSTAGPFSAGAGGYTGMGPFLAGGGKVSGPGTGTSDSILAHLSDGEYVV
ncbi:hypothetical protein NK983_29430, partial [Salmonella enterica subsp. enterica serovar Typhimurium]|nr:hypothetical protein [Salmonella enterica subsp. enterica serovar Typhimurium]